MTEKLYYVGDGFQDEDELSTLLSIHIHLPITLQFFPSAGLNFGQLTSRANPTTLRRLTSADHASHCYVYSGDVQKEVFASSIVSVLKFFSRRNPTRYDIEFFFFNQS